MPASARLSSTAMDELPAESTPTLNPAGGVVSDAAAFREQAVVVLGRLRLALAELLEPVPGGVRKSRDVQNFLGVDLKLSWQVCKLLGRDDVLAVASHVPTPAAMRRLIDAARDKQLPAELVGQVSQAYDAYDDLVRSHAGDRVSFESMVLAHAEGENALQNDIQHRKSVFKGLSHFWGAQVETYVKVVMVVPSKTPGLFDNAMIRGKFGLRRLRPDADTTIDSHKVIPNQGGRDHFTREPFDAEAARSFGAAVLPRFSSQPLPELLTHQHPDGRTTVELAGDAVGRRCEVDVVIGEWVRDVPPALSVYGQRLAFATATRFVTPTVLAVNDVLIHRPTLPSVIGRMDVFGHVGEGDITEIRTRNPRLPFRERLEHLPSAADAARTAGVPRYLEMLRYLCVEAGYDMSEFDVYRARVEYPIVDTALDLHFEIPGSEPDYARLREAERG